MMKSSDIGIQEKKAKLFNEWERFTSNEGEHFSEKIASNLKFLNNLQPEWSRHVTIVHQTKDLHTADYTQLYDFLKYNQKRQIAQLGMNMGQDKQMQMVGGNANLNENGNLVAARVEGNAAGHNGNQIRCYNCRGKEEAGIQLQAEEFDLIATTADLDDTKEVNVNCILMANLQQASTSAKFVGDFKSLAKEADDSLAKHKALELEIKRLLRAVVSYDIMFVVKKTYVVDTSNLQTELKRTKERFENCIIKKKNEYAKLWNDCYKKCDECKYDKNLYDKAYKDMQKKIKRLQAQLGDLKGKSKDTSCVSDTTNPLSQKLESENAELEFQVLNYAKENAHLKATYKNMCYSIFVLRTQTKTIIASLQNELQNTIYENAKLRAQLFKKVSVQKDNTRGTSKNTKFAKQSILGKPPMLGEIHALSKPVTLNSTPTQQESKVVKNDKVIALGMFRINPFKTSREENHVPNNVRASAKTKPITVSQPSVIAKKDVNSDSNGLSST
nr:hypothetical protein [Tanacetum cinerariifolium]